MQKFVFLIDDDLSDHAVFKRAVARLPFRVQCEFAEDGFIALSRLNREAVFTPDFIFIDIYMQLMNGIECLVQIKKIKRLKDTHIYMYSASADQSIVSSCIKLGASGVITKVPSAEVLRNILEETLQRERIMVK